MRFLKTFLLLILWMWIPSVSFADDLWGSDGDQGSSIVDDYLRSTPAPEARPVETAPVAQPAPQPVAEPVAEPVAAPEPIVETPQATEPVQEAPVETVAEPVAEPVDSTPVEPVAEFDSANAVAASAPVEAVATDSVPKEAAPVVVQETPETVAASTPVDGFAIYDSLHARDGSNVFWSLGLIANGSYGLFNQKLISNSFLAPSFGGGITAMFGYSPFALRLDWQFKHELIYVHEDAGTINESITRMGGGAFARFISGLRYGVVAEVGVSVYASLTDDIVLYEDQRTKWALKALTEIPLEISLGYKIPVEPVSFEVDGYFSYDIGNSMNFAVGSDNDASAWRAGVRVIGWLYLRRI